MEWLGTGCHVKVFEKRDGLIIFWYKSRKFLVCKIKTHKRCAANVIYSCKWTTLDTVTNDTDLDVDEQTGHPVMPHQWLEGNLPVSAKCALCDRTCGSVLRLQDWRCLWCKATVRFLIWKRNFFKNQSIKIENSRNHRVKFRSIRHAKRDFRNDAHWAPVVFQLWFLYLRKIYDPTDALNWWLDWNQFRARRFSFWQTANRATIKVWNSCVASNSCWIHCKFTIWWMAVLNSGNLMQRKCIKKTESKFFTCTNWLLDRS